MQQFRFLDWAVYQSAKELLVSVESVVRKLSKEYRYDIGSQFVRAAHSVVLNIAEGSGKSSDKEMNRFFEIALGSLYETVAAADGLKDLKLIEESRLLEVIEKAQVVAKQLGGFKKALDK